MEIGDSVWDEFRDEMPVCDRWAYLDHAAVAPLPRRSAETIARWAVESSLEGDTVWASWEHRVQAVRQLAAELIGAESDELALVANTTTGLGLVAEGFPWRAGENVVTLSDEFPSNRYCWLNLASRGVETRLVDPPVLPLGESPQAAGGDVGQAMVQRLLEACDSQTRLVAVSWVSYCTGRRLDLERLAEQLHRRGILLLVDAIQGLGVFPLDLRRVPVDFLAADGHKWLLGPEGAGLLFVRRRHLDLLRPLGVGWNSAAAPHDFQQAGFHPRLAASRYEGGSYNMLGIAGLGESLELLQRFGLAPDRSPLADRVLALADDARHRLAARGAQLTALPPAERSGILTFSLPGHRPADVRVRLHQAGVAVSCRGGGVRLSPHAYNNQADIERLIEALPE